MEPLTQAKTQAKNPPLAKACEGRARPAHTGQPRAIGALALGTKALSEEGRGDESALSHLHQSGALKALFAQKTGTSRAVEAIVINTAGGVTGGDRFSARLEVGPGSALKLTTQAAERAYRAQPGECAQITNSAKVGPQARLAWLPQETILFQGCALRRSLRIDLDAQARLLMVEPLIFGRAAMGEKLTQALFHERIEITRAGLPLYRDALHLEGDLRAHLARTAIADGAGAMANVICAAPEAEAHLPFLRALFDTQGPAIGGVSLIEEGLLAARLLAPDGFALRQMLVPVLERLGDSDLPRSWMI